MWVPQGQGTQRGDRGQDRGLRVHREGIGGRQRSQGVGTSGTGYTERG